MSHLVSFTAVVQESGVSTAPFLVGGMNETHFFAGQGGMLLKGNIVTVVPKNPGFVVGEWILQPLLDRCWSLAERVDRGFSSLIQWPPSVKAAETPTNKCILTCFPDKTKIKVQGGGVGTFCQESCAGSDGTPNISEFGLDENNNRIPLDSKVANCYAAFVEMPFPSIFMPDHYKEYLVDEMDTLIRYCNAWEIPRAKNEM
jgi:hypothetical protein